MKVTMMPIVVSALRTIPKGVVKRLEDLETRGQVETIQTRSIKNGHNTEKSPGDLKKLAVTQTPVRNHQFTLV